MRIRLSHIFWFVILFADGNLLANSFTQIVAGGTGISYNQSGTGGIGPFSEVFALPGGSFSFNNAEVTTYNTLMFANSSSSMTATTSPVSAYTYSFAGFYDSLKINSPGLTGESGYLVMDYSLTGSIIDSGSSNAGIIVDVTETSAGPPTNVGLASIFTSPPVDGGQFILPITFGSLLSIEIEASALTGTFAFTDTGTISFTRNVNNNVQILDFFTPTTSLAAGTASADLNFLVTGLQVVDSELQPVPGATFTSFDGLAYSSTGITPEPSTFILGGAGIVVLLSHWRLRRGASDRARLS